LIHRFFKELVFNFFHGIRFNFSDGVFAENAVSNHFIVLAHAVGVVVGQKAGNPENVIILIFGSI